MDEDEKTNIVYLLSCALGSGGRGWGRIGHVIVGERDVRDKFKMACITLYQSLICVKRGAGNWEGLYGCSNNSSSM